MVNLDDLLGTKSEGKIPTATVPIESVQEAIIRNLRPDESIPDSPPGKVEVLKPSKNKVLWFREFWLTVFYFYETVLDFFRYMLPAFGLVLVVFGLITMLCKHPLEGLAAVLVGAWIFERFGWHVDCSPPGE